MRTARSLGLRLYPLGTYPLPLEPAVRDGLDYRVQVNTVGPERFLDAGRCAGTHLHLELQAGTVDEGAGISATASAAAREEVSNIYNLATALDPALVALTRSCPFFEGRKTGLAVRTVHYRGSATFGWEGVYRDLPQVGALLPYAEDAEHLIRQQFDRYKAWLSGHGPGRRTETLLRRGGRRPAQAGLEPRASQPPGNAGAARHGQQLPRGNADCGGHYPPRRGPHQAGWPRSSAGRRGAGFEVTGDVLRVPGFGRLGGELLYAAVTGGASDETVAAYLDSILEFAGVDDQRLAVLFDHRRTTGIYPTTEAGILEAYDGHLSEDEGLRLVLEACDELETQVSQLSRSQRQEEEPADVS